MKHMLVSAAVALTVLATTATGADRSGAVCRRGRRRGMHFAFAAHGGPSPLEPVGGHFEAFGDAVPLPGGGSNPTAFHFAARVTGLTVAGNHATLLSGRACHPEHLPEDGVLIYLTDNGNRGHGNMPDQIGFTLTPTSATPPSIPVGPSATSNLDRGNITSTTAGRDPSAGARPARSRAELGWALHPLAHPAADALERHDAPEGSTLSPCQRKTPAFHPAKSFGRDSGCTCKPALRGYQRGRSLPSYGAERKDDAAHRADDNAPPMPKQ